MTGVPHTCWGGMRGVYIIYEVIAANRFNLKFLPSYGRRLRDLLDFTT